MISPVSHWLHSRGGGNTIVLVAVVALIVSSMIGFVPVGETDTLSGPLGVIAGVAALLATALFMQLTNKSFNMLRSDTALPAALFSVFMLTLPSLAVSPGIGLLLAVVMTGSAYLLFSTYGDPSPRRRIFLLFAILSAFSLISQAFIFYLPILFLGCVQMRTFNLKTIVASLIGIITPPWILIGSQLVDFKDVWHLDFGAPSIEYELTARSITQLSVSAFFIIMGITFTCANLMKVYSYNAKTRSFNGYYTLLLLATIVLTAIDFNNLTNYLPLLMAMVAYQASHFFVSHNTGKRSWIGIAVLMAICWAIFIWYTWMI